MSIHGNTVWKFHDFSNIQILREINFDISWCAKKPFKHNWRLWILIFMHFCTFWRLKFTKWTKFTAPKMAKTASFALLESTKLISRKIWVIGKSWNFHTVRKNYSFSDCPWPVQILASKSKMSLIWVSLNFIASFSWNYFILQTQNRDIILEVSGLPCVAQFWPRFWPFRP